MQAMAGVGMNNRFRFEMRDRRWRGRTGLVVFAMLLAGCSSSLVPTAPEPTRSADVHFKPQMAPHSLHEYAGGLAMQLARNLNLTEPKATLAIGSFLPVQALGQAVTEPQWQPVSLQMQESLYSYFNQLGYNLVEFRGMNSLLLSEQTDIALSRDVKQLAAQQHIDYVLAGTFTQQQHGYLVNARIYRVADRQVMAAASTEVPRNVMWADEKVQRRDGVIYRSAY